MRENDAENQREQFENIRQTEKHFPTNTNEQKIFPDVNANRREKNPFDQRVVEILFHQNERFVSQKTQGDIFAGDASDRRVEQRIIILGMMNTKNDRGERR